MSKEDIAYVEEDLKRANINSNFVVIGWRAEDIKGDKLLDLM